MKQILNNLLRKHPDMVIATGILLFGLVIGLIIKQVSPAKTQQQPDTPPTVQTQATDTGVFGEIQVHNSESGEIVIGEAFTPVAMKYTENPDTIWEQEQNTGTFTTPAQASLKDGSMGVLTIEKLSLSTNVYESNNDMSTLGSNIAHFPSTSAWNGNIGLSSHNINLDGSDGWFLNLHKLQQGDSIRYKTALGERTYHVTTVKTITQSDWSYLSYTDDNRITMITCITGQPNNRLVVQAVEIGE